jgi:uncharacterized MnhB-related membrane protein
VTLPSAKVAFTEQLVGAPHAVVLLAQLIVRTIFVRSFRPVKDM